uniref:Cold induced plasma membrane protein n=1 Tax=Rhizophora mucronata TaxID=61149 RepID=A0A2P2K9H2_RHIMU
MVSSKQIQNSTLQPYLRKTPRGGKRMAKRISMQVAVPSAIFLFSSLLFLKISSPKVQLLRMVTEYFLFFLCLIPKRLRRDVAGDERRPGGGSYRNL